MNTEASELEGNSVDADCKGGLRCKGRDANVRGHTDIRGGAMQDLNGGRGALPTLM